jgi:hypothetical protein
LNLGLFDAQVCSIRELAAAHGVEPFSPSIAQPRPKAPEFMADCTAPDAAGADLMIPAKVFEGMRFDPLLVLRPA